MRLTERRKMEVNENRGRLGRKNFRRKSVKKESPKGKRHNRSVKRANHNKGSMNVSDPMVLVPPGGNNHSSRFARCVCPSASFMGQANTLCIHFPLPAKRDSEKRKII